MDIKTTWHKHPINQSIRSEMKGQRPFLLWFTGLSGSGKSTLAGEVERLLSDLGKHTFLLDGDNVRRGLCSDLGFDDDSRTENIRRVAEVSKLMLDAGMIVLAAFISPKHSHRELVRDGLQNRTVVEVFVDTSLAECEKRDVKGLYQDARAGKLIAFTGFDSEYEAPSEPDIHVQNDSGSVKQHAAEIIEYLSGNQYLD